MIKVPTWVCMTSFIMLILLKVACGKEDADSSPKIYAGKQIPEKDYPASVRLQSCSATFIATDKALTAAHCLMSGNELSYEIPRVAYKSRYIDVNRIVIHPFFRENPDLKILTEKVQFDLAVLILDEEVDDFKAPCSVTPPVGSKVRLVGYGTNDFKNDRRWGVRRTGYNEIHDFHSGLVEVLSSQGAGKLGNANIGSGDSGGSLFQGDYDCLLGVNSAINKSGENRLGLAADLTTTAAKAFLNFALSVPKLEYSTIVNRTGAPIFIQSIYGTRAEETLKAWKKTRVPKGAEVRVRYGLTCYRFTPNDESYKVRLRSKFYPGCRSGFRSGCLDVVGAAPPPVRHGTGCETPANSIDIGRFLKPKVSFQLKNGGYLSARDGGDLVVHFGDVGPQQLFEVVHSPDGFDNFFSLQTSYGTVVSYHKKSIRHQDLGESDAMFQLLNIQDGFYLGPSSKTRTMSHHGAFDIKLLKPKEARSLFYLGFHQG